jgi:hypothetical protein
MTGRIEPKIPDPAAAAPESWRKILERLIGNLRMAIGLEHQVPHDRAAFRQTLMPPGNFHSKML